MVFVTAEEEAVAVVEEVKGLEAEVDAEVDGRWQRQRRTWVCARAHIWVRASCVCVFVKTRPKSRVHGDGGA